VSIANLLLALIAIFAAAKLFGKLAERLGQPAVLGELLGGVLIGVSGLHLVDPHDVTIHLLSELGVILLLFLIGLETDLNKLMQVGGAATAVAIVGVALPFIGGAALGYLLGFPMMVSIFLGAALTATSVGITARVLSDLGHLQDRESQVVLGAAVVDDIIGLVLLTVVSTLAAGGSLTALGVGKIVATAFGFVILAILIGSKLAPLLIRAIDRIEMKRGLFFASVIFAFLLAYIADRVGSAIIIGSFAAGLVLARTGRGKEIEEEVHDVAQFFIPIFFVVVGAAVDLRSINPFDPDARQFLWIGLALTAIGIVGKVAAGYVVWQKGMRRSVIGVGMIPRGEVGLIFAQIGLSTQLISGGLYSAVALMVMLTTFIAPPLLRRLLVPRA
jgi:Kef-type K+ transport system membrane component KefB